MTVIDFNRSRELQIKRANTDWWIHEKAIVGENGKTYIVYTTDVGEVHVKELDAKCSKVPSRDFCLCRLNCSYADEHNAPSLAILSDGRLMVAYTGHGETHAVKYRVSERPYDIFSFGEEKTLPYRDHVTYAQLSINKKRGEIWLFTRVRGVTWEFRTSSDGGEHFSEPAVFLASDAGGLFYFDVRHLLVPTAKGVEEQWFFALYGHPLLSRDHTVRSGYFDAEGFLHRMSGEKTDVNLYRGDSLCLEELDTVYAPSEGETVRLLAVSPTLPYRIGLAPFVPLKPETARYLSATFKEGAWRLSAPIAEAGEFLSDGGVKDGSQTYLGGMAYYYGVGDAGLHPYHPNRYINTDRIYIARFDGKDAVLESYVSANKGDTYEREQVIRRIPRDERAVKIWRPTVPIHAQDNLPVYWHEGIYSAHTGGWHANAVMLVDFDD
jgi:hypothetical protein